MPFDNPAQRVEIPLYVEEIAILDRMEELLATPGRWCKNKFERRRLFGFRAPAHCLMGALNIQDHGSAGRHTTLPDGTVDFKNPAAWRVGLRIQDLTGGDAPGFNNDPATTHADILRLIARTRKSFE